MAKGTYTGLTVRGDHIEWCVVQRVKGQYQVGRRDRTPYGADRADGGEAADAPAADGPESALVEALRGLRGALKGQVTLALPVDQVLMKVMTLPNVADDELAGMVELQADKASPFPIETVVVAHEVLSRGEAGCVVLMAAVRKAFVEQLGQALVDGGITPSRVDVDVLGWWRMLRDGGEIADAGSRIHVMPHAGTPCLIVVHEGIPVSFRSLGGMSDLSEAEQAAELARELALSVMAVELEGRAIRSPSIVLWGEGGVSAALVASARGATEGEVRTGDLDALAGVSEGVARRAADGRAMDLTPGAWSSARASAGFKKRLLAAAAGAAIVWLLAVGALLGLLRIEQSRLAAREASFRALQPGAMAVRDLRRRVVMIRNYLDNSQSALECLRELSALLPDDVELTSYTFRQGQDVKLSGEADDVESVYEFKTRIDASPLFPASTLQGPRTARNRKEVFDMDLTLPRRES